MTGLTEDTCGSIRAVQLRPHPYLISYATAGKVLRRCRWLPPLPDRCMRVQAVSWPPVGMRTRMRGSMWPQGHHADGLLHCKGSCCWWWWGKKLCTGHSSILISKGRILTHVCDLLLLL